MMFFNSALVDKDKAKSYMKFLLEVCVEDYTDCGEVNCTSLAEDTAEHLNHNEWLDDSEHEIWAWASEIAIEFNGKR